MNSPSKHSRRSPPGQTATMYWALRASSIGMQMAVPPGLGYLADRQFKTSPWLTVLGVCFGFVLAMLDLFRLAQVPSDTRRETDRSDRTGSTQSGSPSAGRIGLPDDD